MKTHQANQMTAYFEPTKQSLNTQPPTSTLNTGTNSRGVLMPLDTINQQELITLLSQNPTQQDTALTSLQRAMPVISHEQQQYNQLYNQQYPASSAITITQKVHPTLRSSSLAGFTEATSSNQNLNPNILNHDLVAVQENDFVVHNKRTTRELQEQQKKLERRLKFSSENSSASRHAKRQKYGTESSMRNIQQQFGTSDFNTGHGTMGEDQDNMSNSQRPITLRRVNDCSNTMVFEQPEHPEEPLLQRGGDQHTKTSAFLERVSSVSLTPSRQVDPSLKSPPVRENMFTARQTDGWAQTARSRSANDAIAHHQSSVDDEPSIYDYYKRSLGERVVQGRNMGPKDSFSYSPKPAFMEQPMMAHRGDNRSNSRASNNSFIGLKPNQSRNQASYFTNQRISQMQIHEQLSHSSCSSFQRRNSAKPPYRRSNTAQDYRNRHGASMKAATLPVPPSVNQSHNMSYLQALRQQNDTRTTNAMQSMLNDVEQHQSLNPRAVTLNTQTNQSSVEQLKAHHFQAPFQQRNSKKLRLKQEHLDRLDYAQAQLHGFAALNNKYKRDRKKLKNQVSLLRKELQESKNNQNEQNLIAVVQQLQNQVIELKTRKDNRSKDLKTVQTTLDALCRSISHQHTASQSNIPGSFQQNHSISQQQLQPCNARSLSCNPSPFTSIQMPQTLSEQTFQCQHHTFAQPQRCQSHEPPKDKDLGKKTIVSSPSVKDNYHAVRIEQLIKENKELKADLEKQKEISKKYLEEKDQYKKINNKETNQLLQNYSDVIVKIHEKLQGLGKKVEDGERHKKYNHRKERKQMEQQINQIKTDFQVLQMQKQQLEQEVIKANEKIKELTISNNGLIEAKMIQARQCDQLLHINHTQEKLIQTLEGRVREERDQNYRRQNNQKQHFRKHPYNAYENEMDDQFSQTTSNEMHNPSLDHYQSINHYGTITSGNQVLSGSSCRCQPRHQHLSQTEQFMNQSIPSCHEMSATQHLNHIRAQQSQNSSIQHQPMHQQMQQQMQQPMQQQLQSPMMIQQNHTVKNSMHLDDECNSAYRSTSNQQKQVHQQMTQYSNPMTQSFQTQQNSTQNTQCKNTNGIISPNNIQQTQVKTSFSAGSGRACLASPQALKQHTGLASEEGETIGTAVGLNQYAFKENLNSSSPSGKTTLTQPMSNVHNFLKSKVKQGDIVNIEDENGQPCQAYIVEDIVPQSQIPLKHQAVTTTAPVARPPRTQRSPVGKRHPMQSIIDEVVSEVSVRSPKSPASILKKGKKKVTQKAPYISLRSTSSQLRRQLKSPNVRSRSGSKKSLRKSSNKAPLRIKEVKGQQKMLSSLKHEITSLDKEIGKLQTNLQIAIENNK